MKICGKCGLENTTQQSMCRDCKQKYNSEYRAKNPEKYKEHKRSKAYRDKQKQYRSINAEKERSRKIEWRLLNPESHAGHERARRARRRSQAEKYTVAEVLNKYGTTCYLCKKEIDLNAPRRVGKGGWEMGLHIDHYIDIALGGADTLENVRPTHGMCNLRKEANGE